MDRRRELPSVDKVMQQPAMRALEERYGYSLTLQAVQETLAELRSDARAALKPGEALEEQIAQKLAVWTRQTLEPVINGTGVILHTNLGRAPLSSDAAAALRDAAGYYSNLEFDLESGKRGSRVVHAAELLKRLTGAEDALVVNNNAAAVLLVLSVFARRKQVVISRTQLVEIGGGFRIPEVMAQSGARLVEIGTTNRVHLEDYREALENGTRVVLRVHHSNFKIVGFTAEPEAADLIRLVQEYGALFIDDLGSGALLDTSKYGIAHEPMPQESIHNGADLVCFSGDKLLGGPQAGIIVGKRELLAKIKKAPLTRAVRADKLCLAALSATLLHYLKGEAEQRIPVWRMISESVDELQRRAEKLRDAVGKGEVSPGVATIGGGSLPEETLPTVLWKLSVSHADEAARKLRQSSPPVIARIEREELVIDLRTVLPDQEASLARVLKETFA